MATVLITGTNRGLGLGWTRAFLERGDRVIATCRHPERAEALQELAKRFPEQLRIERLDVSDFDQIGRLAGAVSEPIDILINNAGVYGKRDDFGQIDYQEWLYVLRVNTLAPVKMCEAFFDHLRRSQRRLVVAMSSKMGSIAENTSGGSYLYRTSKAALNMAMKSLSIDLKPHGIGVLILHPGWVKTDMGGPNALITVEESVAGMVKVVEGFRPEMSGRFFDYRGQEIPW